MTKNVIIIGAAGRDFHNFNTFFRRNKDYKVLRIWENELQNEEKLIEKIRQFNSI